MAARVANQVRELQASPAANRPVSSGRTTGTAIKTVMQAVRALTGKVTRNVATGRKAKVMIRQTAAATDPITVLSERALKTGSPRWLADCW